MPNRPKTDAERYPEKYFTSPKGHPRDRIIIHESPELPKEGLFFSLNGFAFLAKAGVEIDIPRPVRLMLDTRIRTETVFGSDEKHYSRNIPRINYSLVQEGIDSISLEAPSAEVIDAPKVEVEALSP